MLFLLCSDGVNKELSDDELVDVCDMPGDPREQIAGLFAVALARRARDDCPRLRS